MKKMTFFILILAILLSRFCLVSHHPGDVDPAIYAISLIEMSDSSEKAFGVFNYDMSFGYYWVLSIIDQLTQHNISQLITIQNTLNAVFGILVILIFGVLAKRLADKEVAVFGMLILLLDHSLWLWSLYGHPGVLSIAFFLFSLYFFDRSFAEEKASLKFFIIGRKGWYLVLSGLMGLVALLFRVDVLFVFATYYLFWKYRSKGENIGLRNLLLFYGLIISSYLIIKFLTLGYVVNPDAGIVAKHVNRQFELKNIPFSLITNLGLFAAGIGVLYAIGGFASMGIWGLKNRKFLIITLIGVVPVFITAFFNHMDFARISILIHPILAFFAAVGVRWISITRKKYSTGWGIGVIIIAYIFQTAIVYHPLKKIWLHKFPYQPSSPSIVIRPVPVGWFLSDRKNRLRDEDLLFQHALFLSQQKKNVVVVCSRLHVHRMALLLLQLCPGSKLEFKKSDPIPIFHYIVYTQTNNYRIVNCESRDLFDYLSASKELDGYSVYFLKDLQFPFPLKQDGPRL